MPSLLSRISLVLTLIISTVVELMTNRIGLHLLRPPGDAETSALYRVIDSLGLFSFYFTGLLALVAFAWGLVVLISDNRILALWGRLSVMLVGAAFLPLAGTGLVFQLRDALKPWLNLTFGVLVLLLVIAFVQRRAPIRHKLGWIYLIAPLLIHCYWLATKQMPAQLAPGGGNADLPDNLLTMGRHLVVVGAFAAFLFFTPFPRWSALLEPIPVILAIVVTLLIGGLVIADYHTSIKAAFYGFGLNLPHPKDAGRLSLVVSAFFFFLLTLLSLSMRGRAERSIALGLLLMALSGYQLGLPYQLLLTLTGLLQVLRGGHALAVEQSELPDVPSATDAAEPRLISADKWKAYLLKVAGRTALEQSDAVVLLGEQGEIVRLSGVRAGSPVALRVQLQRGLISELEVEVGAAPRQEARCSLLRRQDRRGERVPEGRGKKAKGFPAEFGLRDDIGVADELGTWISDLRSYVHGRLDVYPGEGLRYVARPFADGWPIPLGKLGQDEGLQDEDVDELAELLTLLDKLRAELDLSA